MLRILSCAVVLAVAANAALAQGVMRKTGNKMESGDVTEMSATEVTLKPTNNRPIEKIPANDVLFIVWKNEPAEVNLARSDEKGGRYQKAIDGYVAAAGKVSGNDTKDLKTELEWAQVRANAKQATTDPSRADDALAKLAAFRKANPAHYSFHQVAKLTGEVAMAKGDAAAARTAYDELAKSPWKDYQLVADIANGRLLQQEGKLDEAVSAYDKVITGATEAEEAQRQEALLGKARVLTAQSKFPEATTILDEVLTKSSPEETGLQAEAYVRQGDCLQAQGKTKEALLAYLHVDVLFESESALHAEALYHLSRLWLKDGKVERADETRARLETNYPTSEWTQKLKTAAGTT